VESSFQSSETSAVAAGGLNENSGRMAASVMPLSVGFGLTHGCYRNQNPEGGAEAPLSMKGF
jgi:hypothetical protein